jgi:hypothetical protein
MSGALATLKEKIYLHNVPSYGNRIFYGLGFLTLMSLVLLVVSGMTLAFMGQAWWLGSGLGIFVRSVHLWSVQAFMALMLLHMLVGLTTDALRPPRRAVWALGAAIFCLALVQSEFGYGLRGDFSAQFRAVSGADFWNGAYLGILVNPLSHLQDFALHIAVIPLAILFLFVLHYVLVHAYGLAKPYRADVPYRMVKADHRVMYARGAVLAAAILLLADLFPSPYLPATRIADVAAMQPALVTDTLAAEYDRSSDTATYLDSIDPYTFDTRQVFVAAPYEALTGRPPTASSTMIATLVPAARSGLYESLLRAADAAPDTYVLRFLSDMGVLEERAGTMGFSTAQSGMMKDEGGRMWGLPPGSWWFAPLAGLNASFDLPDNPQGDRVAAEVLGLLMLVFIAFPYIPWFNRLPEALLPVARYIWREPK